jgi:hypothetical protein
MSEEIDGKARIEIHIQLIKQSEINFYYKEIVLI